MSKIIAIPVTEAEHAILKAEAKKRRMTVANMIRHDSGFLKLLDEVKRCDVTSKDADNV